MEHDLLSEYLAGFGASYLGPDILREIPEAGFLPAYIRAHFPESRLVLDLGFGVGLWFWASFLPSLVRIDGIDLHLEALVEADQVFSCACVPEGYRIAHRKIGSSLTRGDLQELANKRGCLAIQDYRAPWPDDIAVSRYDLVTEHGGGLADADSEEDFVAVFAQAGRVLRPGGCLFFANFLFRERSVLARRLGYSARPEINLDQDLYLRAIQQAGLRLVDFHKLEPSSDATRVETMFYGYAEKPIT